MRRSLRIFPVLFAVIFIGLFMGCMSNDTRFEEMIDEVSLSEEYLSLLEDSAVYPGFSYIAVRSDRVLLQYSGGFASIGSEETVGANTSFPVFSISKLITALAILQLTERGEISLDDHVSNHIPGYPHALTIRSLLNHASGLPDPLWGSFYIHFTEEHAEVDRSALLQELGEKHPPTAYDPREESRYSNLGFAVLGQLIEAVSGTSYEDYVRQQIFAPLGLSADQAGFDPNEAGELATPYFHRNVLTRMLIRVMMSRNEFTSEGSWWGSRNDLFFDFPSHGGMIITTEGMRIIMQAMLRKDDRLLEASTWELWLKENDLRGYHLGWKVGGSGSDRYLYHPGGAMGVAAELRMYPEKNLALFFVTNTLDSETVHTREIPNLSRYMIVHTGS